MLHHRPLPLFLSHPLFLEIFVLSAFFEKLTFQGPPNACINHTLAAGPHFNLLNPTSFSKCWLAQVPLVLNAKCLLLKLVLQHTYICVRVHHPPPLPFFILCILTRSRNLSINKHRTFHHYHLPSLINLYISPFHFISYWHDCIVS